MAPLPFGDRAAWQPDDPNPFFKFLVSETEKLFELGDPPVYNPDAQDSLASRAEGEGRPVADVIYDSLLNREGKELLYRPMGGITGARFHGPVEDLVPHPQTIIALGDGGAHYSMICDAAYTTYMLTYWVRNAAPELALELPDLIKQLSHDPAVALGLEDRCLLQPGYKADINIIDMNRIHLHAPLPKRDLPAEARRLEQKAEGYLATIVSGQFVYRNGEHTGALPGRLVRGAQNAPSPESASRLQMA